MWEHTHNLSGYDPEALEARLREHPVFGPSFDGFFPTGLGDEFVFEFTAPVTDVAALDAFLDGAAQGDPLVDTTIEPPAEGYDGMTPIASWDAYREHSALDYLAVRKHIGTAYAMAGGQVDDDDFLIVAKYFAAMPEQIGTRLGFDEQLRYAGEYFVKSRADRQARMDRASVLTYNSFARVDAADVIESLGTVLPTAYIEQGVKGVNYPPDGPGIVDWLAGTEGTVFAGRGLLQGLDRPNSTDPAKAARGVLATTRETLETLVAELTDIIAY